MVRLIALACLASMVSAFVPSAVRTTLSQPSSVVAPPSQFHDDIPSYCTINTELSAMLQQTELPEKLYFPKDKEAPKILGGINIGLRKLVVVTGASSGLGLNCAATLAKTGRYYVIMACRDVEKGKRGTEKKSTPFFALL
jgi:protochlorophyllide reductase